MFVNWGVNVREDGVYWYQVGDDDRKEHGPFQELSVALTPEAWIEGQAMDAAVAFANAAAAIKVTRFGGRAGAPTRTEVEHLLMTTPTRVTHRCPD